MPAERAVYTFGPFVLDPARRRLLRDGSELSVTPKAFDLLTLLVRNAGRPVAREALIDALWPDTAVEEGNLTFQVSTLRKALGDTRIIVTVPGRGYQLAGEVAVAPAEVASASIQTVVENEERTTITVSESVVGSRRWVGIAVAGAVLLALAVGVVILRRPGGAEPPPHAIESIAVLPFRPLAAASRDPALELGMADTLITRLGRMGELVVTPTSAVREFDELDQDPLEAGRRLGVASVLDGSIQRRGTRIRVTARLLRTSDGRSLWSAQFDEDARDLFTVQDRVAEGVARSLVPMLSGPAALSIARRTTDDLEAYELFVKGLYVRLPNPGEALRYFDRALQKDPRFAAAWSAIADVWLRRGRYTNAPPHEAFAKARDAARRALAIDPELPEAHIVLASVHADYDWDWKQARSGFERALSLNPGAADAHLNYAALLAYTGEVEKAVAHAKRAKELDPLSFQAAITYPMCLRYAGRPAESVAQLHEVQRIFPGVIPAELHLGLSLAAAGRPGEARDVLARAMREAGDETQLSALYAGVAARAGDRGEALRVLREIESRAQRESVASVNVAWAWTAAGDHDRAFAWLERALRDRSYLLRILTVEPGFAPLRTDPRYADLVRRMGL